MEDRAAALGFIQVAVTAVVEKRQAEHQRARAECIDQGADAEGNGEQGGKRLRGKTVDQE